MNVFQVRTANGTEYARVLNDSRVGDSVTVEYDDGARESLKVSDLMAGFATRTAASRAKAKS